MLLIFSLHYFSLSNVTVVAPTVYDGRAPSHVPYLPSWCYTKEEFSRDASWHDSMRWCWENFWFKWCWWEKFESNRIVDVNLWCWWENFEPNPTKIKFIRRQRVHGVISPSFKPFGKLSKQWNGGSQFFLWAYCSFSLRFMICVFRTQNRNKLDF